ncbi:hypothetical protein BGX28_010227 [Mortierella sp. GBA30]|nr:hypothetical protein BGX28_010227 [Mortierella sp. GBA30]
MQSTSYELHNDFSKQPLEPHNSTTNSNIDSDYTHALPSFQPNSSTTQPTKSPFRLNIDSDRDTVPSSSVRTPALYNSGYIDPKDETMTMNKHARKPSLTDALIATTVSATSNAVSAASTLVAVARNLVIPEEDDDNPTEATTTDLGVEAKNNKSNRKSSSGVLSSLLKGSSQDNHRGLEFSQRRMSKDHIKKDFSRNTSSSGNRVVDNKDVKNKANPAFVDSSLREKKVDTTSLKSIDTSDNNLTFKVGATVALMPVAYTMAIPEINPANLATVAQGSTNTMNTHAGLSSPERTLSERQPNTHTNDPSGDSGDPENSNNIDPEKDSSRKTTTNNKPDPALLQLKTMYVAGHGPESARHQAMNVDHPAVSHTSESKIKHSGLGVDKPKIVGEPRDPNVHRTGSLHVDNKHPTGHSHDNHEVLVPHHHSRQDDGSDSLSGPVQTSMENSKVIPGNQHRINQHTSAEDAAIIAKNPYEAHMSHHRGSSSSGLGVDHPVIPTAHLAGSGSSDNTNRNRPRGTYNSAINVDKAGSADHKSSGMGVDGPATAVHHLASARDPLQKSKIKHKDKGKNAGKKEATLGPEQKENIDGVSSSTTTSSSKHFPEDDREGVLDKVKNVFRRRTSVNTLGSKESSRDKSVNCNDNNNNSSNSKGCASPDVGDVATAAAAVPPKNSLSLPATASDNVNTVHELDQSRQTGSHPDPTAAAASSSFSSSRLSFDQPLFIPAEYSGPVPQLAPGEEVIWVRRVLQTDYYDDDREGDSRKGFNEHRSLPRSFLDHLLGRHPAPPIDKGKQRVQS